MKGFVASAMATMVKAKSLDLQRPLQLALSRDEEVGLLGALMFRRDCWIILQK